MDDQNTSQKVDGLEQQIGNESPLELAFKNIRNHRKLAGLTIEQAAEGCGMSVERYQDLEKDAPDILAEELIKALTFHEILLRDAFVGVELPRKSGLVTKVINGKAHRFFIGPMEKRLPRGPDEWVE